MTYITLYRDLYDTLWDPQWPRLAFTLDGADRTPTPRILDENFDVEDSDVDYIDVYLGNPWRWCENGDTPAAHAWQAAIECYEALNKEAMFLGWIEICRETEPDE